jgi:hypothetical protein
MLEKTTHHGRVQREAWQLFRDEKAWTREHGVSHRMLPDGTFVMIYEHGGVFQPKVMFPGDLTVYCENFPSLERAKEDAFTCYMVQLVHKNLSLGEGPAAKAEMA